MLKTWWKDLKRVPYFDEKWFLIWITIFVGFIGLDIIAPGYWGSSLLKYAGIFLCVVYANQKYEKDYKAACGKFLRERDDFEQKLRSISFLRVMPSQANYFLCEILPPKNANQLVMTMLKNYNILVRDCSDTKGFDGKQYMRIAIRSHEDNARFIKAFKELDNQQTL